MVGEQVERDAAEYGGTAVGRGRADCLAVVEDTVEYLHGYGEPDALRALGWRLVGPAFAAHLRAQEGWAARIDNDRLTDGFRALDAEGIVAREDFACCQNCGTSEIGAEVADGDVVDGFVFYHYQDAEQAVQGGSLWLAYGSLDGEAGNARVGHAIVAALRAEGLEVLWDGSTGQRIQVRLAWERRRHGRMAAYVTDPEGPDVDVEVVQGWFRTAPRMPVTALAQLVLPWLPDGVKVRVDDLVVHRERQRLVSHDGRAVGRFDGLRLVSGGSGGAVEEPGLLEVTFEHLADRAE